VAPIGSSRAPVVDVSVADLMDPEERVACPARYIGVDRPHVMFAAGVELAI